MHRHTDTSAGLEEHGVHTNARPFTWAVFASCTMLSFICAKMYNKQIKCEANCNVDNMETMALASQLAWRANEMRSAFLRPIAVHDESIKLSCYHIFIIMIMFNAMAGVDIGGMIIIWWVKCKVVLERKMQTQCNQIFILLSYYNFSACSFTIMHDERLMWLSSSEIFAISKWRRKEFKREIN